MTIYTNVFGNQTLPPSEYGYSALTITVDTTLVWPYNTANGNAVSKIMDVICGAGNALTLPDATQVSTGEDLLIRNKGANTLTVKSAGGATIGTVLAGAASYFYLTDNTTSAGVFGVIAFGVGTCNADAASLVGYGIKAIGNTLNQSHPTLPTATGITIDDTHRSKLVVFTGGAATLGLTTAVTLGDDYFTLVKNSGVGTLTIDPSGSETVDGQSTMNVQPGESLMLICTGATWYTVGYGRSTIYQFTQLVKDISAGGTITLTASEASNKLLTFIGNPSADTVVIAPSVVAVYYTYSNISTNHSVLFKTSSGTSIGIPQGARIIAICDGTNMLSAQSAVANASLSLTDGSSVIPSIYFATQTNTGIYKYSTNGLGFTVAGVAQGAFNSTGLHLTTALEVVSGGTGATSASAARTNLGITATGADTTYAYRANNLSDLANAGTARTNLGLGTAATAASSDFVGVGAVHAAASKTTPVDADEIGIQNSASSYALAKLTWANLKATLKTYFDALYLAAGAAVAYLGVTQVWTKPQRAYYTNSDTVSATGSFTFDGTSKGQICLITLTNATTITFAAPTNIVEGTAYTFILVAGDTSSRTFAWNAAYKNTLPTAGVTTSGASNVLNFIGGASNTLIYNTGV